MGDRQVSAGTQGGYSVFGSLLAGREPLHEDMAVPTAGVTYLITSAAILYSALASLKFRDLRREVEVFA